MLHIKEWLYNILVAVSQLLFVFFYNGAPDQTLSGEIGRRLSNSKQLDLFLGTIKWIGDRTTVAGKYHWWNSMERDRHYREVRKKYGHGYQCGRGVEATY